jgi:hypothetical protein
VAALVRVVHAERLADPRQLAALFAELGAEHLQVALRRRCDDAEVDRLVELVPAGSPATFRLFDARLDAAALELLGPLVDSAPGSLTLHTDATSLHIWPGRAALSRTAPVPDVAVVADALEEAELAPGTTTIGDTVVTLDAAADGSIGHVHAFELGTPRLEVALRVFRALAGPTLPRVWVGRPTRETLERLPAFLRAIGGEVELDVDLPRHDALDLALDVRGEMVIASHLLTAHLPDGELSTELPATAIDAQAEWRLHISAALSVVAPRSEIE